MWMAPKQFADRDQWRRHPDYKKKMTGPLDVLGGIDGFLQAIVRYVECKLLFSGVTSSQGITLASHGNIERWYKGIVRNVEQATDEDLPAAEGAAGSAGSGPAAWADCRFFARSWWKRFVALARVTLKVKSRSPAPDWIR